MEKNTKKNSSENKEKQKYEKPKITVRIPFSTSAGGPGVTTTSCCSDIC
jgi:hypothetical protein